MIHSLRAFHHRNFRLFFVGQSLGIVGYRVQQIAIALNSGMYNAARMIGPPLAGALWLARQLPRLRHHIRPIYVRLGIIS